jgi:HK97 family phage major capsid protein
MSEEDEVRLDELHTTLVEQEERILAVRKEEKRTLAIAEARKEITPPSVEVRSEPRVYGKGSDNSYFFDAALAVRPQHPRHNEALERQERYAYEVATHIARNDKEGKRAKVQLSGQISTRRDTAAEKREAVKRIEQRGKGDAPEFRTPMSTALGFGGELVTPVYLESDVVPYREAGRPFADQCNKQPLPDYGMTVYLPYVSGPAGIAAQVGQNQGIAETDPTTGYLSSALTTEAGQVTLSQQLLDRAGPNFAFDLLVYDQLQRAYNPQIDTFVLTAALANANAVTYTAADFQLYAGTSMDGFVNEIAHAKANIRTTAGTFLNPTHLFITPDRAEYITTLTDTTGRPLVVQGQAGPFNAATTGTDDFDYEGPAGFKLAGLPVFTDNNIPVTASGSYEQAVVLVAKQIWYWEGTPVTRAVPQTLANDLSVLIQMYSYVGAIVPYPNAVQSVSGTGLGTSITWSTATYTAN